MPLLSFPAELLLMVADLQHTRADLVCLGRVNRRMGGICQSILFKSLTLDIYGMTSKDMKVAIDMLSKENIKHLIRSITVEGPPRVSAGLAKTLRDTILKLPNLLSVTFIDTAHQFKDVPIPSDRLQQFTYIDHWYNQSSSEDLFKFLTRSSNLSEIVISIDHASGFYKTIQQVPGQFSNLRSLHAPLVVCKAVLPTAPKIQKLSIDRATTLPIKWTLLELDHLIPETMWENLNVLLLSNIKVSSDFLYSVRKKGKALLYLDFELDTTLDSWKRLLNDLLDLNLLGLGIRIVAERDWMPEDEYRFAMAEKAVSSERLIKQTGLLKTWVSVLDSNMSWCREDVEADWVRAEESVPMWFFRA